MKPSDFTIGQKMWFESSQRHIESRELVVSKVTRKWVHLSRDGEDRSVRFGGERFAPGEDMVAQCGGFRLDGNGFSSQGMVYLSKESYHYHQRRLEAFREIRRRADSDWKLPDHVTLEQLNEFVALLKGPQS